MPSIATIERKRAPASDGGSLPPGKSGRRTADAKATAPAPPPPTANTGEDNEPEDKDEKQEQTAAGRRRKKGNARSAETDEVIKILPALAKLTLQNTQKLRSVEAILLETWLLPTASPTVSQMRENTQKYSEVVGDIKKAKGDLTEVGPPHLVAFEGMIDGLTKQIIEKTTGTASAAAGREAEVVEHLKKASGEWKRLTQHEANDLVPYCRVSKTYKPETTKIQVQARDPILKKVLVEAMSMIGSQRKVGQAAPGALERLVQRAVD